jgi:acetylornithine deacetylase
MTVTQINAGKQHNVVPAECHLVVRVNDCYSNQEILDTVRANVTAEINPRSMHFFYSCFSWIGAGIALGRTTYGCPPFQINRF